MTIQNITLYKQIYPAQCQILTTMGYKSLINLRSDCECDNQPTSEEIFKAAQCAGLVYHNLPIDGNALCKHDVEQFAQLVQQLPKPVMVFCYSGSRAKRLYQSAIVLGLLEKS